LWYERSIKTPELVQQMLEAHVPQRRFATPQDVATPAAFLSSSVLGFPTGSCFVVDGGQTRWI
jgi:3-oxoacyl-[acyl-carrier protein] reductase